MTVVAVAVDIVIVIDIIVVVFDNVVDSWLVVTFSFGQ